MFVLTRKTLRPPWKSGALAPRLGSTDYGASAPSFVSGHRFSGAARMQNQPGFSRCGKLSVHQRFPQIYFPIVTNDLYPPNRKRKLEIMRTDIRNRFSPNDSRIAIANSLFLRILRITTLESRSCGTTFPKMGAKSLFQKILRVTTLESRICRHNCTSQPRNSNESKILQKVIEK